ncbi:MAG: chemotaxis protein CheA [Candidatus Gastranaerophilales bacterium]|nr:chemotaxis protein CheA [Candidatus Gastranaerophilales bacterium]
MDNNEVNMDDILRKLLEEEEFVESQAVDYQEYLPDFIAKALEDLEIIETNAIELDNDYGNMEVINSMFRSFHNIKGSSGFVGQDVIQKIAHQTETLMDGCRKDTIKVNKQIIDLILNSVDFIKQICEDINIVNDETFLEIIYVHLKNLENIFIDKEEDNNTEIDKNNEEDIHNQYLQDFINETQKHIEIINKNTLDLEKDPANKYIMYNIFRGLHSIKGLAGFASQTIIQRITHDAEALVDCCIKGTIKLDKNITDLICKSNDYIKKICDDINLIKNQDFLEELHSHLNNIGNLKLKDDLLIKPARKEKTEDFVIELEETESPAMESFVENFMQDFIEEAKEHLESIELKLLLLEKDTNNREIICTIFRSFHNIKGSAGFVSQTLIQKIAHSTEILIDRCRRDKCKTNKNVIDLILNSADFIKKICNDNTLNTDESFINNVNLHIKDLDNADIKIDNNEESFEAPQKLGEILVEQNILSESQVKEILDKQKDYPELKFGQIAVKEGKTEVKEIISAIRTQQSKVTAVTEDYMRIATSRVDNLVDMIGELIINQSLVEQEVIGIFDSKNLNNLIRMSRITKDIQNLAMQLRMVSLKSTFNKITRIARDTINELGKDIHFTTSGDEIEIDRIIIEKLQDPLVHLVKNAISHGIEEKEERVKNNKSSKGNVKVLAYNKRSCIYIEVCDDGGGIDCQRVYKKALEKNLIDSNRDYSEKEILEFILLPGFSTVENVDVNNISGRGVGMDVVKTEISKIGGKIEINNKLGEGCTFILKIPVNHAVMNGTIVDINGQNYIIPTVNLKKIIQPQEEDWISVQEIKSMIRVREDIIPLINLGKVFGLTNQEESSKLIIIIEMDQKFKALPVRNVVGRREIVVKPVSPEFSQLKFVSSMSILGDGKVSLILDIENLFETEGVV